ncbi:hypothetical protein K7432_008839 [Basidiobolus ranarum]|uniref:Uncharacterized protein n=1 Tax=Basidiobolus ranarum TaxID=34480 RepID=A0ABR2VXZ0_9FUNG
MKFAIGICALVTATVVVEGGYVGQKNYNGVSYLWTCPGNPVPALQVICAKAPKDCTFKAPWSFTCTDFNVCNLLSKENIAQGCTPKKV